MAENGTGGYAMKQTLVIGSAVTDVIINIDHLPHTGEDIHISSQSRSLGGCACIVSDILRHSGAPYSLCTAIGSGLYGSFVEQELKNAAFRFMCAAPMQKTAAVTAWSKQAENGHSS